MVERVDPRLIDGDGRQVAIRGGGAVGHDLRSAQLPHSGCCGACPATRCGWRAPEWGGSCLRSLVLVGKGQLEGRDGAMFKPSQLGIPDGPERDYQSTP